MPDAFACYRRLVEEANETPTKVRRDIEVTEAEDTWWEVTEFECQAFELDPRLASALMWAHIRYCDMVGVTDSDFQPYRAEERAAFPMYFKGEAVYSIDAAIGFMVNACQLPYTQVSVWVCRYQVQTVRSGLCYGDTVPPAWAVATQVEFSDGPDTAVPETDEETASIVMRPSGQKAARGFDELDDELPF